MVRAGALRALGHHRSEAAFDYLLDVVSRRAEHPQLALPAAILGLAQASRWQQPPKDSRRIIPLLTDLMSLHEDPASRKAAISGTFPFHLVCD
jgi:hypothetical protein